MRAGNAVEKKSHHLSTLLSPEENQQVLTLLDKNCLVSIYSKTISYWGPPPHIVLDMVLSLRYLSRLIFHLSRESLRKSKYYLVHRHLRLRL